MRRHAAYFRTEEDADPNDDLWESHRKYNGVEAVAETKMRGPGMCARAREAVGHFRVTGRATVAVICLMLVWRFAVLEPPAESFGKVASREEVERFVKERFERPWRATEAQREAYALAANLSSAYEAMMMPSMWDGWRRMLAARGPPAKVFRAAVDDNLRKWGELMESLNASDLEAPTFGSRVTCPHSLSATRGSGLEGREDGGGAVKYDVLIPCGLHRDSAVIIVGKPIKSFDVQLMADAAVVYKLQVFFHGDRAPFILQSLLDAYTERCPGLLAPSPSTLVDTLPPCSAALRKPQVIKPRGELESEDIIVGHFPGLDVLDETWWFPFAEGQAFVFTMTFGLQGYHVSVDGNHVCSFLYNQAGKPLESITAVRIGGEVVIMSVMANGLLMPKKSIPIPDHLRTPSTALNDENVAVLVGVASISAQFERRMGVRRTWAQYPEIRSGRALLRFFVGLTRTKNMNRRIFKEANLFKDVVILPFVDGQRYAVLKTVAMCVFMIKYTQAPHLLKAEDDTFVRVDAVLPALETYARGLLRASFAHKGLPAHARTPWYSSKKEWPWSSYPKSPRGPGYAISRDIAAFITKQYEDKSLELFRVECVAMGSWVDLYQRQYLHRVNYIDDATFLNKSCEAGYTIAHGQNLEQMLCLWKRLQNGEGPVCCNNLEAAE